MEASRDTDEHRSARRANKKKTLISRPRSQRPRGKAARRTCPAPPFHPTSQREYTSKATKKNTFLHCAMTLVASKRSRSQEVSGCCPPPLSPACVRSSSICWSLRTLPPAGACPNSSLAPLALMALTMRPRWAESESSWNTAA